MVPGKLIFVTSNVDGFILHAFLPIECLLVKHFIKYNLICVTLLFTGLCYRIDVNDNLQESTVI